MPPLFSTLTYIYSFICPHSFRPWHQATTVSATPSGEAEGQATTTTATTTTTTTASAASAVSGDKVDNLNNPDHLTSAGNDSSSVEKGKATEETVGGKEGGDIIGEGEAPIAAAASSSSSSSMSQSEVQVHRFLVVTRERFIVLDSGSLARD